MLASIMLANIFIETVYAQEAQKLYSKKYSKLSFVYQLAYLQAGSAGNNDQSNYPSMTMKNSFSNQFGFYYNLTQKGNWNFKTGIIAKEFWPVFDLNVKSSDLGLSGDYDFSYNEINNAFILSIPIKAEYMYHINSKINIVAGIGVSYDSFTGGNENLVTKVTAYDEDKSVNFFIANSSQEQRSFATELSIGTNYDTKFALLQLDFFLTQNLSYSIVDGFYTIYNLKNIETKNGSFTVSNNFYGLSLSITPIKGWLKRKK